MILAILASMILWPLYVLVSLALDIVGLMLIGLLVCIGWKSRQSKIWTATKITAWPGGWLTWLWGNEEDGVTGPVWWRDRTGVLPLLGPWRNWRQSLTRKWSAYRWSALRNPSNNMRFIPWINPVIDPARIGFKADVNSWFVWQGLYAGYWRWFNIRGQVFRFIIGWKLKPSDAQGVDPADMRAPRCGFGLQFKRVA